MNNSKMWKEKDQENELREMSEKYMDEQKEVLELCAENPELTSTEIKDRLGLDMSLSSSRRICAGAFHCYRRRRGQAPALARDQWQLAAPPPISASRP